MNLEQCFEKKEIKPVLLALARSAAIIREGFLKRGEAGKTGTVNVSGEEQESMDVWADNILEKELFASGSVSLYASEERDEPVEMTGRGFTVVADPLDGSGNIPVNLPVGTIFGIFPGHGVLRRLDEMVAAGYVLFGPLTTMVVSHEGRTDEYVLCDHSFVLKNENLTFPAGKDFVISGSRPNWTPEYYRYVEKCFDSNFKSRNIASMVADFQRALKKGGLYSYPGSREKPQGKIRLLFEAGPLSFVAEGCKGVGHDGHERILDKVVKEVHQCTPVFVGSENLAKMALEAYRNE